MDNKSAEERSLNMSRIRSEDTRPEMIVRRALRAAGYGYRLHAAGLPGKPDIVMKGRRIAVFVHGCFWHAHTGCPKAKVPETRREFWAKKLAGNRARDREAAEALLAEGWRVLWIWQCALGRKAEREALPKRLRVWIEGTDDFSEFASEKPEVLNPKSDLSEDRMQGK